jgi:hypothetical protein
VGAGALVNVGVLLGAGVVVDAVPVGVPGGGAKTAALATPGAASASAARPQAVAWMIEGERIGFAWASEDTACRPRRQAPAGATGTCVRRP